MSVVKIASVPMHFADIYVAKQFKGTGEPAFSAKFAIDPKRKDVVKAIQDAIKEVADAKWEDQAENVLKAILKKGACAFSEDEYVKANGEPQKGFEGMFVLSTRNPAKNAPAVFDRDGSEVLGDNGTVAGGDIVHASVEFWAQDNDFGKRINCNLRGVRLVKRGERYGSGTPATSDEFNDLFGDDDVDDLV